MPGRPTSLTVGQMRHRITLQYLSAETVGSNGDITKTWSTLMENVPCKFEQVSGGEVRRGKQVQAQANALFTCRFVDALGPKCRISFDGNYYEIISIDRLDGIERYMEIQAARSTDND